MGSVLLDYRSDESGVPGLINPRCYHWGLDCDPATNNLAELLAIRNTLLVIPRPDWVALFLHSDSEWAIKVINGDYRAVCHTDLITDIQELIDQFDIIKFQWVRGHHGETWQEMANELAQREAGTWKGKR